MKQEHKSNISELIGMVTANYSKDEKDSLTNQSKAFLDSDSEAVSLWLWKIWPIFLFCFGSFGNMVTITVLLRRNLRSKSSSVYFLALAVTDLFVLHFSLLIEYLFNVYEQDIRADIGCGLHMWLVTTSVSYSSWILVVLTIERVLSIRFPFFIRNRTSRKSAVVVLLILFVLIATLNSHLIFNMSGYKYSWHSVATNSSRTMVACIPSTETSDYYYYFWPWIVLCIVSLIPFMLLAVGNCYIGYSLIMRARSSVHSSQTHYNKAPSKLLVLLNTVFLICTLPTCLYMVIFTVYQNVINEEINRHSVVWQTVSSLLMYTNNAVNFILYCVSGNNFRQELKSMLQEIWQLCFKTQVYTM